MKYVYGISFEQCLNSMARMVLVQPFPYKTDCTVLMQCLRDLQRRGNVVYANYVGNVENHEFDRRYAFLWCQGNPSNFQADGKAPNVSSLVDTLHKAARRICHLPGWMIQLFVPAWAWDGKCRYSREKLVFRP